MYSFPSVVVQVMETEQYLYLVTEYASKGEIFGELMCKEESSLSVSALAPGICPWAVYEVGEQADRKYQYWRWTLILRL